MRAFQKELLNLWNLEYMTVTAHNFNLFLLIMSAIALVVFIALHFIDAGYGKFYNKKWGPSLDNKLGWVLMESPVFIAMLLLWLLSERKDSLCRLLFLLLFELHYFQRSFIFPFLIKGKTTLMGQKYALKNYANLNSYFIEK